MPLHLLSDWGSPFGGHRKQIVAERFGRDFRRFFLRGLAAVLPALLTVAILVWVCIFIWEYVGRYTNIAAQWVTVQFATMFRQEPRSWGGPASIWRDIESAWGEYKLAWIGFVLAFVAFYIFGRFIASFLGKSLWRGVERAFFRVPVLKQVYPSVKQVTDFLLSDRKIEFSRVVAVQYPRKGVWSVGLVTSPGMKILQDANNDMLTVFVPSSPMPVTGYTITIRRDEVVDLPLSIDEALRFTVSGGVVVPTNQRLSGAQSPEAQQALPASLDVAEVAESCQGSDEETRE